MFEGNIILGIAVFYPIIGSIISYLIGRKNKTLRDYVVWVISLSEAAIFVVMLLLQLAGTEQTGLQMTISDFGGLGLFFVMDGFRLVYGTIAAFMWAMTSLLSKQYFGHYHNRNRYYLFLLLTLGATEGVLLSGNLYTTFVFFEMMSFTSYVWVAHDEKKESLRAAETYLAVAVIGGLVMLMGIFLLYDLTGDLTISTIMTSLQNAREGLDKAALGTFTRQLYAAGGCMLFGFGAKAGMFPLHIWLPKAHPVAPAPASALLSGILTKAGMFGILIISCNMFYGDGIWGSLILLLGTFTMVIGAVLAVFSINLKRTLACSSVSQIGFILVGVGMGCLLGDENALAARGALLHMVNHSLIKLVLFMAAGVVFMNLHELDLNKIKGFGRKKPVLMFSFLMGAFGIGGIPLWNGYVSKTLIHESIVEYVELLEEGHRAAVWFDIPQMHVIEWAFLISGGMTVAYMTKLFVVLFVEKNSEAEVQAKYDAMGKEYLSLPGRIALLASAVLLPIMGFFPGIVMNKMADLGQAFLQSSEAEAVHYLSTENLKGAGISIAIGIVLYLGIRKLLAKKSENGLIYLDRWPKWLDLENMIYRPVLLIILPFIFGVICRILDSLIDWIVVLLRKTIYKDSPLPHELEEGTYMTNLIGGLLDGIADWKSEVKGQTRPEGPTYSHRLANWHENLNENVTIVARSLSFGLALFCIGLMLTVIYLLLGLR